MGEFIQLLVSGAIAGSIYSLIAAGLTLSYTATGIFNLAYGGIAFSSAMLYFQLISALGVESLGMRLLAFVIVVFVFCPLLGQLLNVAVFRPLARASDAAKVMATIGILVALPALTELIVDLGTKTWDWGLQSTDYVFLTPGVWKVPSKTWIYDEGGLDLRISSNQWTVLVVAVVVAVLLWAMMRHTRLGLQMRAVVDRPELAGLRGVSESQTSSAAWIIGTMLAGLAGVIGAPVFNSLDANQYNVFMFIATAAAVVGGLRSIPLAFFGGVALGVVTSWVGRYATFAQDIRGFHNSVPFVVLLVGLLFMARERTRRSGVVADATPITEYTDDLPAWRVRLPWLLGGAFILLQVFIFADQFWLGLWITGLALALVFMSWVLLTRPRRHGQLGPSGVRDHGGHDRGPGSESVRVAICPRINRGHGHRWGARSHRCPSRPAARRFAAGSGHSGAGLYERAGAVRVELVQERPRHQGVGHTPSPDRTIRFRG